MTYSRARQCIFWISIILFTSFPCFYLWYDIATDTRDARGGPAINAAVDIIENGNKNVTIEYTITYKNYIPFEILRKIYFTYKMGDFRRQPTSEDLLSHNFTLYYHSHQTYYGDVPVGATVVYNKKRPHNYDDPQFNSIIIRLYPFSREVVKVKISYERLERGSFILTFRTMSLNKTQLDVPKIMRGIIPADSINIWVRAFVIFVFYVLGCCAARFQENELSSLIYSFGCLARMERKKAICYLETAESLNTLANKTNTLLHGFGVLRTPAITLFKMFVRSKVDALLLYNKIESFGREESLNKPLDNDSTKPATFNREGLLKEFLDDDSTKPAKSLIEFRTIALIIGLFTSFGFAFNWNVGAITPICYVVLLMLICVNFGYLLYLVRKSSKEIIIVMLLMAFIVFVVWLEYVKWNIGEFVEILFA